jgi:HPt (histidine-containing phosphotransfer) domain-containing protein
LVALLEHWLPATSAVIQTPTAPAAVALASGGEAAAPAEPSPAPAPEPTASPLDGHALAQIRSMQRPGAPNLLNKIIGLYLESSPGLLQKLRDAVAGEDAEALRQAAHSLKSSSANLGATRLATLCKELEQRGRESRLEDAPGLLGELEVSYVQAREALEAELESPA